MELQNEKVEYGKREIKDKESNVNEVKKHTLNESEALFKKTKIIKKDKFTKEEGIRE